MFEKKLLLSFLLLLAVSLQGCSLTSVDYTGLSYPATQTITYTFRGNTVPSSCKLFSHAILTTPPGSTSAQIHKELTNDARKKGAHIVFIGLAKSFPDSKDSETFIFNGFGPEIAYDFNKKWIDWEFGYSLWSTGEELVSLGYKTFSDTTHYFEEALLIKHTLLHCQKDN